MNDGLLNILLKEEESVFKKIQSSPAYDELLTIQKLISSRGGLPQYTITVQRKSQVNDTDNKIQFSVGELSLNEYNKTWSWEKKTEYAFKSIGGKGRPSEAIDCLIQIEGVGNLESKKTIANNVYNSIVKLKKKQRLIKDISEKSDTIYIQTNEEAFMNEH